MYKSSSKRGSDSRGGRSPSPTKRSRSSTSKTLGHYGGGNSNSNSTSNNKLKDTVIMARSSVSGPSLGHHHHPSSNNNNSSEGHGHGPSSHRSNDKDLSILGGSSGGSRHSRSRGRSPIGGGGGDGRSSRNGSDYYHYGTSDRDRDRGERGGDRDRARERDRDRGEPRDHHRGDRGGERDRDREHRGMSSSGSYRDAPHHSSSGTSSRQPALAYKVLCISSIHPRATDEIVRDAVFREFKRFGEISVKIVNEPDERVAYVYFRTYEDARDAKHSKTRILIYDKPVMIEAAYESTPNSVVGPPGPVNNYRPDYNDNGFSRSSRDYGHGGFGSLPGAPSYGIGGGVGHRRSPVPPHPPGPIFDRGHRDDHRGGFDRGYQNPGHIPPPPHQQPFIRNDFRGGRGNMGNHQPDFMPPPPRHQHPGMYQNRFPPGPGGPPMGVRGPVPPQGPPMGGPMNPERPPYENKKDKFPNYLHHILPEDDPLATRTLFTGNLEVNISDEEMRRIFGRYGIVEDIDIKRPPPGTGNAFAFVRFANLDMAARAKMELSGQYIGKFQCKIGYGKVNPTTKIWVGGLGPWASMALLEREFDRFGSIKKIDWNRGDVQAFITYETIDAAAAAVKDMRGYPLGGPEHRLRTDFAGVEQIVSYADRYDDRSYEYGHERRHGRGSGGSSSNVVITPDEDIGVNKPYNPNTTPPSPDSQSRGNRNGTSYSHLSGAKTILDLSLKASLSWQGALILKSSSFPAKLYMTEGDLSAMESFMKDEEDKNHLRITQRLRLDQGKLDDVEKRMTPGNYGIFLALPVPPGTVLSPSMGGLSPSVQSRSLRNLISYLKQKDAAGVITVQNKGNSGVLYVFPPHAFSVGLLQKVSQEIEVSMEIDYLVIVVIRGGIPTS